MNFLLEKVSPGLCMLSVSSQRRRALDSVLQEEHLQLPGWQVQLVQVQEALVQAIFGRCLGGLGRKVMCFGGRSLMLDDLLQVSVLAKGKAIFIPLLTLAERSPLQSSTSTSGLGKSEIGCMGDCISKRKSPSQYPYSGLG
jgi:hypothetical protein